MDQKDADTMSGIWRQIEPQTKYCMSQGDHLVSGGRFSREPSIVSQGEQL